MPSRHTSHKHIGGWLGVALENRFLEPSLSSFGWLDLVGTPRCRPVADPRITASYRHVEVVAEAVEAVPPLRRNSSMLVDETGVLAN